MARVVLRGKVFAVEHRKLGLGIFGRNSENDKPEAEEIVRKIRSAVKVARPFFNWLANRAVESSEVNVTNEAAPLFSRYEFLLRAYRVKKEEAGSRKNEVHKTKRKLESGGTVENWHYPAFGLEKEARWLALATIEAFFSWTEHVFIHIAILLGRVRTARDVAVLAEKEWADKFKVAIDLSDPKVKALYDDLVEIRRQLRNQVAHGAFGKEGQAFRFHSEVGAVPVVLPQRHKRNFTLGEGLYFDDEHAITRINELVGTVWSGEREPAKTYIQDSGLPIILSRAVDGSYQEAMRSCENMEQLVDFLNYTFDSAANMEW